MPSYFRLEYELIDGSRSNSAPYLDIGASSSDRMIVGQYVRTGTNGLMVYPGGASYNHSNNTTTSTNVIIFEYTGGDYTYSLNGVSMTVANKNVTLSKLLHIETGGSLQNELSNIKIIKL